MIQPGNSMRKSKILSVEQNLVRGFLHVPRIASGDGLVLTHGAGSNCQAPLLVALGNTFFESGITVLRCNLPFRQKRPHGPPPRGSAELDQQGLREAVSYMRTKRPVSHPFGCSRYYQSRVMPFQ